MHRVTLATLAGLLIIGAAFTVLAGSAAAQGLEEPLLAKTEEKATAAQDDPAAFVATQATESQLADDANWTIAYGCYLTHEASAEAGVEPPELDQCADFEEALGIAEEAAAEVEEEAVADAQELEDDVTAEAEVLAEDALATVADVVEDPGGALDALAAFLDRAVRAVQRILDAVLGGIGDIGATFGDAFAVLGKASLVAVAAPFVGAQKLGLLLWDGGSVAAGAIGTAVGATIDGIATGARATADAVGSGATSTWSAIADAAGAVKDAVTGIFGDDPSAQTPDQPVLPDDTTRPVTDTTNGLLDTVTGTLDA